jgi:hypothetical protein
VIAAGRPAVRKQPRFVDVDVELDAGGLGESQQEVREERARRAAANDRDARTVFQRKFLRRRLDEGSGDVVCAERCYPMIWIPSRRDDRPLRCYRFCGRAPRADSG